MGMFAYLLLGIGMYVAGIVIFIKRLKPKKTSKGRYAATDPILRPYLAGAVVFSLGLSLILSHFVLGHNPIDVAYVLVNTLVATGVFYFGLNPDDTNLKMPD